MNKNYVGSSQRTLQQAARHLLETEYGFINSRRVIDMLVADIAELVTQFYPETATVQPGRLVFTGTLVTGSKAQPGKSAGDYPLVTLAWPLIIPQDIEAIIAMPPGPEGRRQRDDLLKIRLQRLIEHGLAHPDGPVVLTNADLSLMLGCPCHQVSRLLQELRQETGKLLLTKGYYFDQGVRPTHKAEIVTLYEQGFDETDITRTINHDQTSVGRYLRDYERVKLLLPHQTPVAEIALLSGLHPSVVDAYVNLIRQFHPDLLADYHLSPNEP
jgi:hypothetical protein